jgi:hypothetical protein
MALRLMPRSPRRRIRLVTVIGGLRFCRARFVWRDDNRSRQAALQSIFTHDDAASTASRPNVRDDGQRPFFSGQDGAAYSFDLPDAPSEIFLQGSLDRANHVDPTEEIVALEQSRRSRFDGHLALTAQAESGSSDRIMDARFPSLRVLPGGELTFAGGVA